MTISHLPFYKGSLPQIFLILLGENLLLTLMALFMGFYLSKVSGYALPKPKPAELRMYLRTVSLNTLITYIGFLLWNNGYITIHLDVSIMILIDAVSLFILMDLTLYLFHYVMHRGALYQISHKYHHQDKDLKPIHFFAKHPMETMLSGLLRLAVLGIFSFNIYAIIIYLVTHILFGIINHTPGSAINMTERGMFRHLITPGAHYRHHLSGNSNYGAYTLIWDRLFKTVN